jgi:hypothetical protein
MITLLQLPANDYLAILFTTNDYLAIVPSHTISWLLFPALDYLAAVPRT